MSILDRTDAVPASPESPDPPTEIIDLDRERTTADDRPTIPTETVDADRTTDATVDHEPRPDHRPVRGFRVRRIRLGSVAKIASVFYLLGYVATMATLVVVWNVALHLGFVSTIEDAIASSLGLGSYQVVGQVLFDLFLVGLGLLALVGLVVTVLLAVVYNASCTLFGGVAFETAPLRRARRVFSLRHGRFVTLR